jgi:sec-independent protein translocase protein TatA
MLSKMDGKWRRRVIFGYTPSGDPSNCCLWLGPTLPYRAAQEPSMLQRAIFGLGTTELVMVLAVVLILFGPKKLPELAKGLGKGLREFRKASDEVGQAIQEASIEEIEAPKGSVTPTVTAVTTEPEVVEQAEQK